MYRRSAKSRRRTTQKMALPNYFSFTGVTVTARRTYHGVPTRKSDSIWLRRLKTMWSWCGSPARTFTEGTSSRSRLGSLSRRQSNLLPHKLRPLYRYILHQACEDTFNFMVSSHHIRKFCDTPTSLGSDLFLVRSAMCAERICLAPEH